MATGFGAGAGSTGTATCGAASTGTTGGWDRVAPSCATAAAFVAGVARDSADTLRADDGGCGVTTIGAATGLSVGEAMMSVQFLIETTIARKY